MSNVQNFGELNIRQVNTSVIYSALNDGSGVGEKRSLTLTCAKDDDSSQLSLTFHHDDDIGGADINTATFSSNTQIKNVLDPIVDQDAATKRYVDDNSGGFATTGASPNFLGNINPAGTTLDPFNHTWTAVELNSGIIRRTTGSVDREDILPNASLYLSAFPNQVVGQIIQLTIINTDDFNMDFNTSADGTFMARGGGSGAFSTMARRKARASANHHIIFNIVIYEIGVTPKIEIMRISRG